VVKLRLIKAGFMVEEKKDISITELSDEQVE
jgi:hypothetical protein